MSPPPDDHSHPHSELDIVIHRLVNEIDELVRDAPFKSQKLGNVQ